MASIYLESYGLPAGSRIALSVLTQDQSPLLQQTISLTREEAARRGGDRAPDDAARTRPAHRRGDRRRLAGHRAHSALDHGRRRDGDRQLRGAAELPALLRHGRSDCRHCATRRPSSEAAVWAAFWKETDPNPATIENEALVDYFERIQTANRQFKEPGEPGWLTDRGKVFITLGEPDQITGQNGRGLTPSGRSQYWAYARHGDPPGVRGPERVRPVATDATQRGGFLEHRGAGAGTLAGRARSCGTARRGALPFPHAAALLAPALPRRWLRAHLSRVLRAHRAPAHDEPRREQLRRLGDRQLPPAAAHHAPARVPRVGPRRRALLPARALSRVQGDAREADRRAAGGLRPQPRADHPAAQRLPDPDPLRRGIRGGRCDRDARRAGAREEGERRDRLGRQGFPAARRTRDLAAESGPRRTGGGRRALGGRRERQRAARRAAGPCRGLPRARRRQLRQRARREGDRREDARAS